MRLQSTLAVLLFAVPLFAAPPPTSCVTCHTGTMFDDAAHKVIRQFNGDVHAQVGLSCHNCHGGNPDPALADDPAGAMDASFAANPFRGTPDRAGIPAFCGTCHSSAEFMRRFNPAARVDQVTEYSSSYHGKGLQAGDPNVATCVDCHSVHDIRRKGDPAAPIHATHVAETCSRCHSDSKRMAKYKDAYGQPLRTDQYARWRVSVHANALHGKNDLTAPTCNDCHGNHGATPPGVQSVSFVCGQCHAREAELFRKSKKNEQWSAHNDLLAGSSGCADCHEGGRAKVQVARFTECVTCHENHGVVRPTVAMLGVLPETPCAFCHEGSGALSARVAEPVKKARNYEETLAGLKKSADAQGLRGNARFDWLVERAQALPPHLIRTPRDATPRQRPEFARLFDKFRIGKTHYTYTDTATGKEVAVAVRSCNDCHDAAGSPGLADARAYLDSTRNLTSMIARSERILLTAQRGGVEVRQVRAAMDSAVDSQIELQTLVHSFGAPDAKEKEKEGLQHAEAALLAGQQSLDELSFRRRGLFFALGAIALALIALALKIRTL